MPESTVISFRVFPETLARAVDERTEPGMPDNLVVRRDIERYYAVLADELRRMEWGEPEASLIVDALNGVLADAHSYGLLWAGISDAIELEGLDRKWGVDGAALVARLRALTPGQAIAVTDAAERFWSMVGGGDERPAAGLLKAVGLIR